MMPRSRASLALSRERGLPYNPHQDRLWPQFRRSHKRQPEIGIGQAKGLNLFPVPVDNTSFGRRKERLLYRIDTIAADLAPAHSSPAAPTSTIAIACTAHGAGDLANLMNHLFL